MHMGIQSQVYVFAEQVLFGSQSRDGTNSLMVKRWQSVFDKDNLYFIIMSSENIYAFSPDLRYEHISRLRNRR